MSRPPETRIFLDEGEITVDSFAGGGGASKGMELALGRGPDIAINHDAEAIALHAANHPETEHYTEDVWHVDPVEACHGRRVGLVLVDGHEYHLADIGMRMLAPRELYRAQGFPDSYKIDIEFNGKPMSKTAQVRMCGNSVCPDVAAAIIRANVQRAGAGERAA